MLSGVAALSRKPFGSERKSAGSAGAGAVPEQAADLHSPRRKADTPSGHDGLVTFNAGGRLFEVLPNVIRRHGSTLLANLLDDIGTDRGRPVFVDTNPDRFPYILDWYRYGEMFVPKDVAIDALLRDARFLMLPDNIRINGEIHTVQGSVARSIQELLREKVLAKWPTFQAYVQTIVHETRQAANLLGERSDEVETDGLHSFGDGFSEIASVAHSSLRHVPSILDSSKLSVSREFPIAEMCRIEDMDLNQLEVQSMAPMLMYNNVEEVDADGDGGIQRREHGAAVRWRWCDDKNVCNELRLRVLRAELERLGMSCSALVRTRHGVQKLILRVDVSLAWGL
eukprot:TRINITY_DN21205_c0_g1_i3.p1 TRINITY_DN21205_c0_g1~~TRINITY_DN21205_c0_g1_i3.p1  ORF type:complete len:363 (+),score=68.28 TRINITY_DN21205_c0_g1_i3:71-1090(+)